MPTTPRAFLGLDFGTTNASVSYLLDDPRLGGSTLLQARDVLFTVDPDSGQQSARVPTLLAADPEDPEGRAYLTGWDCWRSLRRASAQGRLLRHGRDHFNSVKSDLGRGAVYRYAFARVFTTPEVVAGRIMHGLLEEALAQLPALGLTDLAVTLTVPSALSESARRATLEAARVAGLERHQVGLIDEPVAALIDLLSSPAAAGLLGPEPRTIALYDCGGGTLDVTVVRACFDPDSGTGLRVHTLAVSPYRRLGGDVVDRAVMRDVVWPQYLRRRGIAKEDLTADGMRRVEDTLTPCVARGLKEDLCRRRAGRRGSASGAVLEARFRLPHEDGSASIDVREYRMRSNEFEALLARLVRWGGTSTTGRADLEHPVLLEPLVAALDAGRVDPSQVDYLVLHGGGCRNPYVRDLLESCVQDSGGLFPQARILQTPDLELSVARGAAISGYWKHVRGTTYIAPVTPEEIGVVTLSDRPVKLVDGGASLPYPVEGGVATAETVFAVPAKGLRRMLVPFYAGRERPCRVVGTIGVDLPPDLDRGDEVRIRLHIDADKTLHWWYSVDGSPYEKPEPLLDPWAPLPPTGAERRLFELRRRVRRELVGWGRVDPRDLLEEVGLLLDCGELSDAELLLEDAGEPEGPLAGSWHNLKALIWSARGSSEMAHAHFLAALEYEPTNAVLIGNLASSLRDLGRPEEGIARCRAALSKRPDLAYVRCTLADFYRTLGDERSAQTELREGLRLAREASKERPGDPKPLRWLSRLHRELGEHGLAHEALVQAGAAEKDALYGGDHKHRIAGPDSGYVPAGALP